MEKIIEINNLKKIYNDGSDKKIVLNDLDLYIYESEFICIMGPSGSGKTTLLNVLSTIDEFDSGSIHLLGKNLWTITEKESCCLRRDKIGFIFQNYNLLDTLTIRENIFFLISEKNIKNDDRIDDLLSKLKIKDILDKYPYECSGGQQQRAAIARALINNPKIIFADEPTGNLDRKSANDLMSILVDINRKYSTTIVMVSHDCHIASYANKVYFLNNNKLSLVAKKGNDMNKFYQDIIIANSNLVL